MKRLMISVPTAPFGKYHQELVWWLMAVQIQSVARDLANTIADSIPTTQLAARGQIRKMGEDLGIGWIVEQANLHWIDARVKKHLWSPMIPEGWTVMFKPTTGAPLAANRNAQARHFLFGMDHDNGELEQTDYDAVLFIDADNIPGSHDLHHLLEDIERDDVDVVGGVYCVENHKHGPQPLIYEMAEAEGAGWKFASKEVITQLGGKKGLIKLKRGGLPTGCLCIKRHVFQKLYEARRPWFKDILRDGEFENYELRDKLDEFKGQPEKLAAWLEEEVESRHKRDYSLERFGSWATGEDIWFCKMVQELGMKVWVDTRVFWGHIKLHDNKQEFNRAEEISKKLFRDGAVAVDPKITPRQSKALFRSEMQRKAVFADKEL